MNITSSSSSHVRNTSIATEIPKSENATKWLNFSVTQNSSLTTRQTQDLNTTTLDHRAEKELTARQNTTSTARPSFTVSKGKLGGGYRNYTADGSRKNDTIQVTASPTGNNTKVPLSALRPTNSPITITSQDISNRTLNFTQLSTLLLNASHGLSTMAPKELLSSSPYNDTGLLNSSLMNTTFSELPFLNGSMVWDNGTVLSNSSSSSTTPLPNTVTELPFTNQPARTTQLMEKLATWYQSLFNTITSTPAPTTQTVNDHLMTTSQAEPEITTEVTTKEITTKQGVKGASSTPVLQDSYHAGDHIAVKPKPLQGGHEKTTPSGQQGLGLGVVLGGFAAGGLGAGFGILPEGAEGAVAAGAGAAAPGGAVEAAGALEGGEEAAEIDIEYLEEFEQIEEAELAGDAENAIEEANIADVEGGGQFIDDMMELALQNPGDEAVVRSVISMVRQNFPDLLQGFLERLAQAGINVPAGAVAGAGGAAGGAGGAAGGVAGGIAVAGGAAGGGVAIASSSGGGGQGVSASAREYSGFNSTEQIEQPHVLNTTDPAPVTTLVDKVTSMPTSVLPEAITSTKPTDNPVPVDVTSAYINELTAGNTTSSSPSTQSVSPTKGMDREKAMEMIKKLRHIRGDLEKMAQKMVDNLEKQFNISDTLLTTTVTPVTALPTSSTTMDRESILTLIEKLSHIRGDLGQTAQEMMVKLQEQLNDEKESAAD